MNPHNKDDFRRQREDFEKRFPVPLGVKWSEKQQDYTFESYRALDVTASYSGRWAAWQAAREQEVRKDNPRAGVSEKIVAALHAALNVAYDRKGDVDTEDGTYATTDRDSMIHLETALCEAFDAKSDDVLVHELRPKVDALLSTPAEATTDGVFTPCDRYKVPNLTDGQTVVCLEDGEQRRLEFCQAEDGEYWWRDSEGKLADPSHYSLWGIPIADAALSTPAAPQADEWVNDVVAERKRQDDKWGGPVHDDQKSPNDFVQHIEDYAGWARVMAGMGSLDKYRRRMVQVAALAGAAIEACDRSLKRPQPPEQEDGV